VPGETDPAEAVPLTTKGLLLWVSKQGVAIACLFACNIAFGYYIGVIDPDRDAKRDTEWSTAVLALKEELAERDKRSLDYRKQAEDRHREERKDLVADGERQYARLEKLMLEVRSQTASTGRKVEALSQ
jgi:hypothetical protein